MTGLEVEYDFLDLGTQNQVTFLFIEIDCNFGVDLRNFLRVRLWFWIFVLLGGQNIFQLTNLKFGGFFTGLIRLIVFLIDLKKHLNGFVFGLPILIPDFP